MPKLKITTEEITKVIKEKYNLPANLEPKFIEGGVLFDYEVEAKE